MKPINQINQTVRSKEIKEVLEPKRCIRGHNYFEWDCIACKVALVNLMNLKEITYGQVTERRNDNK